MSDQDFYDHHYQVKDGECLNVDMRQELSSVFGRIKCSEERGPVSHTLLNIARIDSERKRIELERERAKKWWQFWK